MTHLMSAREFNQGLSRAKRVALEKPVVITDRGKPSHVLMSYSEYEKLTRSPQSFVERLLMEEPVDVELDNLHLGLQPVEF
ncbi:type II toxin-antitoxin system Phd/YefM family antitoxin [Corynebacterium sp. P3-F1]|uniref:type II toxin-antitoxin system Phd/YefM family antitoxin n=1 Tax=Corynebacterium sp. P3-F1 TaxID=3059080 RepID=UPI00265D5D3E|nr:type II toxin-antitoxin system Phd/YefM family antitoxin [Corynebacterium sp. P3-F1]WKK61112.1 type II toxin-antitoxin system Phd/YefM family antitoxin [Corynebacterium sp. P3-F1]